MPSSSWNCMHFHVLSAQDGLTYWYLRYYHPKGNHIRLLQLYSLLKVLAQAATRAESEGLCWEKDTERMCKVRYWYSVKKRQTKNKALFFMTFGIKNHMQTNCRQWDARVPYLAKCFTGKCYCICKGNRTQSPVELWNCSCMPFDEALMRRWRLNVLTCTHPPYISCGHSMQCYHWIMSGAIWQIVN